ncbi:MULTISPECIES: hypothetical protein [Nitrosomonas]|uniref:hypothetical protein n=1 Tax=Nitrosomonas TaxID=914 RepID=UPI0013964F65|nr:MULTISPECIES: hypothetical protein [Nitrosomonas]UVS63506.1 hypothetical protein NX761_19345 [Nitrosomonas sp. PLL12]
MAYQNDVTSMTRFNPFGNDRGNMINIIVMAKKEKRFHSIFTKIFIQNGEIRLTLAKLSETLIFVSCPTKELGFNELW